MSAIYLLVPLSLGIAVVFLCSFIWAVRSGQYEDTCTPALRMLADDDEGKKGTVAVENEQSIEHER